MAIRKRAEQEFENSPADLGQQKVTLAAFNGGLNNYTSPELMSPQFWAQGSNAYSGQFGTTRRARWAQVVNASTAGYTATGSRFTSLYSFRDAEPQDILLGDIDSEIWSFQVNGSYAATKIIDGVLGTGDSPLLAGPWSRFGIGGIVYGMNGQIKRHFRGTGLLTTENWGLDTPDSSPQFLSVATGPNLATVGTDLGDRSQSWTNPNNLGATGSTYADCPIPAPFSTPTNTIQGTGFGFALPNEPVFGISVSVDLLTDLFGITACYAQLVKGGVLVGNIEQVNTFAVGAKVTVSFGSSTDLWGSSWLFSDVNASNFGVAFYFLGVNGLNQVYHVNNCNITVYTVAGSGLGNITKNVGRSYSWAWENANIGQVSAPSPVTPYYSVTDQLFTIRLMQPGSLDVIAGNPVVTVVDGGTTSDAWVNTRHLYVSSFGDAGLIVGVTSNTITVKSGSVFGASGPELPFQVFDPQSTDIRLYATSDGGSVYFRIQRNAFDPTKPDPADAGLVFIDNDNSEPPNGEFTSEIEQVNNLPPPIGDFVDNYQSRMIVYGVPGAPASFFYSNFETTSVGNPPDCFAPLNQVTFPMGDAKMFGTANLPTGFIVWSNKQDMFKLTGLLSDNTVATDSQLGATVQRLPYKMGSGSPHAIAVTNLGVFWLTSDRKVMLFTDHYAPKDVGQSVQGTLNSINGARMPFARMKNYRNGDRNWLELSIATGTSTFNNVKLVLDLSLLSSNGQASFFTFDMATNQPSWFQYDVNCEAVEVSSDNGSTYHTLSGDVDTITETDWQPAYYKIGLELTVPGSFTLHALGNEAPEVIKSLSWMRVTTNQLPNHLPSQGWKWNVLAFDDDKFVLGVQANTKSLVPGTDSLASIIGLENSPASFRFGATRATLGRRFQFQTIFPSAPGDWEMRSYQIVYDNVVVR